MKQGTFHVTEADDDSAIVRDVTGGQIHTLADNPGVEAGDVVEATLEPEPPMEVVWHAEIEREFAVEIARSEEPPTQRARETAADQPVGEVTRHERAGTGEVHVLTVSDGETEAAVSDVLDDEATVERAARLGVERVEVRGESGVVSVRYLP
ncbi:MAG: DUF5812 family protein [Haloarculaceae archaeon]